MNARELLQERPRVLFRFDARVTRRDVSIDPGVARARAATRAEVRHAQAIRQNVSSQMKANVLSLHEVVNEMVTGNAVRVVCSLLLEKKKKKHGRLLQDVK